METEPSADAHPEQQFDFLVVPPVCGTRAARMQCGTPASAAGLAAESATEIAEQGTARGVACYHCAPVADLTALC